MNKIYGLLFVLLITFPSIAQESSDSTELRLPALSLFEHNKIPTVNGVNPTPAIFSMTNQNASQLLTASFGFQEQSISMAPLNFSNKNTRVFDLVFKAGLKDDITFLGGGFNLKFGNGRINRLYHKNVDKYKSVYNSIQKISNPTIKQAEWEKFSKFYRTNFISDIYEEYNWKQLIFHANASVMMFDLISGNAIDADNNGIIDNYYGIKGFNGSGGFSYVFVEQFGININANYSERRATAAEDAVSVAYYGGSVTLSKLFIVNQNYLNNESFHQHSFIPGFVFSLAVEYEEAINNIEFAENGIKTQMAISPMFDFKIAPLAQIRLALSVNFLGFVDDTALTEFRPVIQYNLQLPNF